MVTSNEERQGFQGGGQQCPSAGLSDVLGMFMGRRLDTSMREKGSGLSSHSLSEKCMRVGSPQAMESGPGTGPEASEHACQLPNVQKDSS